MKSHQLKKNRVGNFKLTLFIILLILISMACGSQSPSSDIKLVENWTLENCGQSGQVDGNYLDISVWENRQNDAIAIIQMEERLLGSNDIVLDSKNMELQIAPGGQAVNIVDLKSGGSKVQEVKRTINSTFFSETSIEGQDKIIAETFFKKTEADTITLGLDINNQSDFGLALPTAPIALVINSQNKIIDILKGDIEENIMASGSISNMLFESITGYYESACFQRDYSNEEITFWYFVPMQISTESNAQFSLSGKALYKP